MALTESQRQAVEVHGRPLFIQAGAGTGKTFTLTNRLAYGLSEDSGKVISGVDNLLTITFTNKAAGELLGRVRAKLRECGLMEEALRVDAAWISTIHAMCKRILSMHALDAGIDAGADLLSEEETDALLMQALDELIERRPDQLASLLRDYSAEAVSRLIKKLALVIEMAPEGVDSFELGPSATGGPVTICANLLSALNESKAALEDAGVADQKPSYVKNYESICQAAGELEKQCAALDDSFDWGEANAFLGALKLVSGSNLKSPFKDQFTYAFEELLNAQVTAAAASAQFHLHEAFALAQIVCDRHEELKRSRGAVDTNDLLIQTYRLLRDNPDIARRYEERFDSIMVDEFQDTDQLQVAIMKMFCDETLSALATVGDAQQSIYGFRGADLEVYRSMRAEMAQHDSAEVELTVNFRSHPDILGFVESVFSTPEFFGEEFLQVTAGPGNKEDYKSLKADDTRVQVLFSAGSQDPENGRSYTKNDALRAADARAVADAFEEYHALGAPYGDMAILLQSTKDAKAGAYLRELRSRGIPCVISGGSDFYTQVEVQLIVMLLRFIADRDDDEALFSLLGSRIFDISDGDLLVLASVRRQKIGLAQEEARSKTSLFDALCYQSKQPTQDARSSLVHAYNVLQGVLQNAMRLPLSQLVLLASEQSGWKALLSRQGAQGAAIQANIQRMCDLLDDYENQNGCSVAGAALHFRSMCELAQNGTGARGKPGVMVSDGSDAVQLMTIHASKGLEFPIVAVAEYDLSPRRGTGGEVRMLTEDGKTYLSLGASTGSAKARPLLGSDGDEAGKFAAASDAVSYVAHASALSAQREREERQRLLYVALTRAREVLLLVVHDKAFLTKEELGKTLGADVMRAVFPDRIPGNHDIVRCSTGAKIGMRLTEVPCVPSQMDASTEDVLMHDEQSDVLVHPLPSIELGPQISSWLPSMSPIESYSSLSDHSKRQMTKPVRNAIALRNRDDADDPATVFGSAFHLAAQKIALAGSAAVVDKAKQVAVRRYGLDDAAAQRLEDALDQWCTSSRFVQASEFPACLPEHPFCVAVAGIALEGYIDLLCLDGKKGEALVIDYKTGAAGSERELADRYRMQACCYAYAVLSSDLAQRVELVFVRPEVGMQEVTYVFDQEDILSLGQEILGQS